jgi:hypothetical protein
VRQAGDEEKKRLRKLFGQQRTVLTGGLEAATVQGKQLLG